MGNFRQAISPKNLAWESRQAIFAPGFPQYVIPFQSGLGRRKLAMGLLFFHCTIKKQIADQINPRGELG